MEDVVGIRAAAKLTGEYQGVCFHLKTRCGKESPYREGGRERCGQDGLVLLEKTEL